nr:hypothetical protein [Tanacetum cinerariifolium]
MLKSCGGSWTGRGWMSSVLESFVSVVASGAFSSPGGDYSSYHRLRLCMPQIRRSIMDFLERQDTVDFEFGQNRKNQHFGYRVDSGKFHEIPHSNHNKENLVTHVNNNYHHSSDCNLVPVHRQTETVVGNHNHHVCRHINCTSNSRTEVV